MKKKIKVNTEKLEEWMSPSQTILKPKIQNRFVQGKQIMTEEEFNNIMNDE